MSRGPGHFQVRVMATLKAYHDLGSLLEWEFSPGGSFIAWCAPEHKIRAYENGEIVELWKLKRDMQADKTALSRALRGLENMGYVRRLTADLEVPDFYSVGYVAKYASLTKQGREWLEKSK